MKVAYIVKSFPVLSETFVLNQITGLLDRGVEVDVYASWRGTEDMVHPAIESYSLLERTSYSQGVPENHIGRRARMTVLFARALARNARSPQAVWRLLRYGREDAYRALGFVADRNGPAEYDAIHCHFGTNGDLALALRTMGVLNGPLLTTFHGYDISRYLLETSYHVYDRLFQEGDLFLPISDYWREKLIELGCPSEKIHVHRMGVDCEQFSFEPRSPPSGDGVRLLSVARLVEKKGIEYAIRAVAEFAHYRPDVEYVILGDGPLRPELEALVAKLEMQDRIKLLGGRPQPEVAAHLRRAHVLLAPSVTGEDGNMEGIPVALMEALATGIPVVSTHHSGIPELVKSGTSGLLAPERDVEALVQCLNRLVTDADLFTRLSVAGRQLVEDEYNIEKLNDRLVELFRSST